MRVVFGLKAHSGWAALVVLGKLAVSAGRRQTPRGGRRQGDASWAKQPYHAAERLSAGDGRAMVERGVVTARRIAVQNASGRHARTMRDMMSPCAVVVDRCPIGPSRDSGRAFPDAQGRRYCSGTRWPAPPAHAVTADWGYSRKHWTSAERALASSMNSVRKTIASLGSRGPPWGRIRRTPRSPR